MVDCKQDSLGDSSTGFDSKLCDKLVEWVM